MSTVDGRWYIQNEVVSGAYGSGNKFGIERIRRFKACRRNSRFAAERRFGRFHAPAFFSMEILLLHHFTSKVKKGLEKQLVKTWLVLCFFPHFPLHHPVGARESNPDPDRHPDELRSSGGLRLWQLYRARLQIRLGAT